MRNYISRIFILGIFVAILLLTSCNNEDTKQTKQLLTQDVLKSTYIVPEKGIEELDALEIVSDYLINEAVIKGDFSKNIEFEEITTQELWDNNRMQLFRIKVDYAWFEGVAMFKEGSLIDMISGQHITGIIISDLNMNEMYDICLNFNFGSGMINSYIEVYDSGDMKTYGMNLRDIEKDVIIEKSNDGNWVDVYYKDMNSDTVDTQTYAGRLTIVDNKIEVKKP